MGSSQPERRDPRELSIDYGLTVQVPPRQQAFLITVGDWNRIKDAIESIHSLENHWFTAFWAFLTLGVSFLIGLLALEQQNNVAFGFRASFLALTAAGFVASLICFIAYWIDRGRRKNQVVAALQSMNQIETSLTQSQIG